MVDSEKGSAREEFYRELDEAMNSVIEDPQKFPILRLTRGEGRLILKANPEGFLRALPPEIQKSILRLYDFYSKREELDEMNPSLRKAVEKYRT